MDSGSNRGLTPFKKLLRNFKYIKPIPVKGIGSSSTACSIRGVGFMDVITLEGDTIEFKMYWAPDSSETVVSPNAAVTESHGRFTSWTQTSHVVGDGTATLTFFHKNTGETATISMGLHNNLW